jgi:glutathione peroxidase
MQLRKPGPSELELRPRALRLCAALAMSMPITLATLGAEQSKTPPATRPAAPVASVATSLFEFRVRDIDGAERDLAQYRGKVVLVVNVASNCGFTLQYAALQKVYDGYQERGLVVLGFPSNDFRNQEPGTDAEIKKFATGVYHATFPLMSKVTVVGPQKTPVYRFLTESPLPGEAAGPIKGAAKEVEWNFTKFLVGRDGKVLARFPSKVRPDDPKLLATIEQALAQGK